MGVIKPTDWISIGQLAKRTGTTVSAIRFYEARGLVAAVRNAGGQRRFLRAEIRRLSFILIAQQLGYTIAEIGELLSALPDGRTPTKRDWSALGRRMRKDLDHRIETLTRLRESLDGCIGCGCLSLKRCAIYNAQDSARANGAGPRYLMGDRAKPG